MSAPDSVDADSPWLGLASFTEETQAYFFGREGEVAELTRRVQRKLLTVLFGKSGLGKTSILQAGLVPGLRAQGYFPVYLRIDYGHDSPEPAEQIKRGINRAARDAGVVHDVGTAGGADGDHGAADAGGKAAAIAESTRSDVAAPGESIWEFLHHRDDALKGASAEPLIPLLIFDQFEELFTLAQSDEFGRARAARFIEELADLVENRPPKALEAKLDTDDSIAERFDFSRSDYRVVIALREDYLAPLESLKRQMPTLSQNRLRLAPMTGSQALEAVLQPGNQLRPGKPLVSEEVAEAIVRFVAGGAELANAEVEPSLLSLICRELNEQRVVQRHSEISQDLLAGSHETILTTFYERSLADQPEPVRRIIEDDLLTESGYRENLAEESLLRRFQAAGAAPDALAKLVNRRLLRIEERLDIRRVELTHDVLTGVVKASRDQRHEREAREATERALAEQRQREAAAHRAMLRARTVATVCAVLMLLAIASAIFGWLNMRRARVAEIEAQSSRSNAEKLVNFLIEDLYTELAPTGQLATLGNLAHMTVGYYDSVPPQLLTKQTRINRAMALVREGASLNAGGQVDTAYKDFGEAQAVFEKLRAAGDHGEAVTYGLALTLYSEGFNGLLGSHVDRSGRSARSDLENAADLLRPLVYAPHPSGRVRQLYADTLNIFSHAQRPVTAGVAMCDEALKILAGLGALNLSDLTAASSYADTADSEARELLSLGRIAEAKKMEQQVAELVEKILAQRPGDLHALEGRSEAAELLGALADRQHDDTAAEDYVNESARDGEDEVRFNSSSLVSWQDWARGLVQVALLQFERGEVTHALATLRSAVALEQDPRRPSGLGPIMWTVWTRLADMQAQTGNGAAAAQSLKSFVRDLGAFTAQLAPGDPMRQILAKADQGASGGVQLIVGTPQAALSDATANFHRVEAVRLPAADLSATHYRDNFLIRDLRTTAMAAIRLGRYPLAEALARQWLTVHFFSQGQLDPPQVNTSEAQSVLAHAIAMQGRDAEARKILQPALAYYRAQQQAGARGTTFRHDFAYALYVSAISSPADAAGRAQRNADLGQATRLIDGASAQARRLWMMRRVTHLIAAARESQREARP